MWQPIETAQKDRRIIKVRHHGWAPFHVFWKDAQWKPIEYQWAVPTHWFAEPPTD